MKSWLNALKVIMIDVNGDCETVKKYYSLSSDCKEIPPSEFFFYKSRVVHTGYGGRDLCI